MKNQRILIKMHFDISSEKIWVSGHTNSLKLNRRKYNSNMPTAANMALAPIYSRSVFNGSQTLKRYWRYSRNDRSSSFPYNSYLTHLFPVKCLSFSSLAFTLSYSYSLAYLASNLSLTHWSYEIRLFTWISNFHSNIGQESWIFHVKFPPGVCHKASLIISQHRVS